jgi:hypothetical protein
MNVEGGKLFIRLATHSIIDVGLSTLLIYRK